VVSFLQIQAKRSLKKWLVFLDKKGLQLWLDLTKIKSKKSLKQRLDFSDKKEFQLWSDFLKLQAEKSLKHRWCSYRKMDCNYGQFPSNSSQKIIETTVRFLR